MSAKQAEGGTEASAGHWSSIRETEASIHWLNIKKGGCGSELQVSNMPGSVCEPNSTTHPL